MGQLNLYKIDSEKHENFITALEEKYNTVGTIQTVERTVDQQEVQFELSFFIDEPNGENHVEWNWLLEFFGNNGVTSRSNPKGILVIKDNGDLYACTYGFSFFIVDKYCDTDFAFNFARRIRYKEIKTTTLLSPSSKKNKMVNTYINYNNLEFDSGESFAKLKVKADLPEGFELFEPGLEAGHSIKFELPHDNVDAIIDILLFVKKTLLNARIIYNIPLFNKVSDKELIENLNNRLEAALNENPMIINLSELDIIGVTEIFNHNDSSFVIKYHRLSETLTQLTSERIIDFIQRNHLTIYKGLESVKIISFYNGVPIRTDALYNLIDYTDDEARCVLTKGKWYYYNDDYLSYLAGSLAEIDAIYDPHYDYTTELYEQFIMRKYQAERDLPEYNGMEQNEVIKKLRNRYYRERAYNLYLQEIYGFECHDREETSIGGAQIELMDLYKDETLFAVKFGSSSSVLCYAVDQSTSTLKLYKHRLLDNLPIAKKFGVWLLLDRRTHLEIIDGKPNINELEMLTLKNKLDAWKKEVRVLGYIPILMINYFN